MTKKWWLAIAAILMFAVLLAIGIPAFMPLTPGVTYANYSRLEKGMTRDEVETVLGKPTQIVCKTRSAWKHASDSIWVDFDKDGRVRASAWNDRRDTRTSLQKLRDRFLLSARTPRADDK
jgi:outer membrane protein assembly factor BamE (lipoprotein component of BamABCDE complex)